MFELGSVRNKNVRQILNKHFLQAMFAVVSSSTADFSGGEVSLSEADSSCALTASVGAGVAALLLSRGI